MLLLFSAVASLGQGANVAKQVYDSSQDSVFLIYLNDSAGSPSALGSAFLVAPRILVTNAHVAEAGSPVLAVGPVRIPLKVVRIDQENDLAILSVDVDLTSKPLPLASGDVSPGDQVFAIGNPEGLEKTISQGIVSGLRNREGRNLLQITSPISHGSSGGPILNSKGEVVGVAVGMLEDGQNLNFAVPVRFVRKILEQQSPTTPNFDLEGGLRLLKELAGHRDQATYSEDPSSDYQQTTKQIFNLMGNIVAATNRDDALIEVACLGTKAFDFSDLGIKAARKLVEEKPSAANRALLSYLLYDRAEDEGFRSAFAEKGSDDQTKAEAAHDRFLAEASQQASDLARTAKGDVLLIADFVLGGAKNEGGEYADAVSLHSPVAAGGPQVCGVDLSVSALQDLILEANSAHKPDDAERWFRKYASIHEPAPYERDSEGDRRNAVRDFLGAGDSYEKAAVASNYYGYDYCFAAVNRYADPTSDQDAVLNDGKKCIEASVKQTVKENEHYFTSELPIVYKEMATILEGRGVYPTALEYIKESLATDPNDAFALNTEAKIFKDLEQYSECIAAAQAAIAASDGKYPWMHFELGSCSFETQNWTQAAASFRIVAESDKTDAVSAFNLGLSLSRQGFAVDAEHWFREALSRKPDSELRAKILNALQ